MPDSGEETLAGDETGGSPPPKRGRKAGLRRGDQVGRYTVLELLGRGGMGLVYAAYDPQLDRRVAVKVLRSRSTSPTNERARRRLLREAQAMAKLSHPNVVAVHDVGTVAGEVFIAMELIDGPSLDRWLEEQGRPWREVVEAFAEAGQGLAAAHVAGLVHRDFKPANVLVDRAGRARVTDFGLVHVGEPSTIGPSDGGSPEEDPVQRRAAPILQTDAGLLMGTPAYMAPEQHEQTGVDARTDQFGFCVALYEALFHQHPFGGDSVFEVASAITQGAPREIPSDTPVPAHVRHAVLRGLAREPDERWPTMEALLVALLDDPARRHRRWLGGAAVVAAVAGAVALGIGLTPSPEPAPIPCAEAGDELDRVWTSERRETISRAFDATAEPHAATVWARSADAIERYAERWRGSARDACEATRVRGEQSDSLFDLRRACLERRLHELDTRLAILAEVDQDMLEHSIAVATSLTPVDVCEDTQRLTQTVRLPEDPGQAEQVEALLERVEALEASLAAGRAAQIVDEVDRAVEQAVALGHAPTRAHARGLAAAVHEDLGHWKDAEQLLLAAAEDAGEGRDDRMLARVWANMPFLVGHLQARFDDADLLVPVARAALARVGRPDDLVIVFEQGMGATRSRQGDRAAAREHYRQALSRLYEDDGRALSRSHVLNNLGVLAMIEGDYAAARAWFEKARVARAGLLPPDHPDEADYHQNLGNLSTAEGDYPAGLEHYDRALAIVRAAQPKGGPEELLLLTNRAQVLTALHRSDEARANIDRALALAETLYGPDHPVGYAVWIVRAQLERMLGHLDEARTAAEHSIELASAALGPEHQDIGVLMLELGAIELRAGNLERAAELLGQAHERVSSGYGPEHPQLGIVLRFQGAVDLAQGRLIEARERLDLALAILERRGDADELARARFDLARSLPASDIARGRRLAEQARERLAVSQNADEVASIDLWLASAGR